jgi:hypothetical protein
MSTAFSPSELESLIQAFSEIPEYRKNLSNTHHKSVDLIAISVFGIIAGADGPDAIAVWAKLHREPLTRILNLENGVHAKDTIRRTLEAIKPEVFQQRFLERLDIFRENNEHAKEHIAIDGKTLRRSHDGKNHPDALHVVSAWSSEQGISRIKSPPVLSIHAVRGLLTRSLSIFAVFPELFGHVTPVRIISNQGDTMILQQGTQP